MIKHTVVTSFTAKIYEEYGWRFVTSYTEHWKVPCVVYAEAPGPDFSKSEQTTALFRTENLDAVEPWKKFEAAIAPFPIMSGQVDDEYYTIRYDARMARKTFIEADAGEKFDGKVFWIDADVVTHADVPEGFLDEVLPDNKLCVFLGRDGGPIGYTESGFIGFNTAHPEYKRFMHTYCHIFQQGIIFTLPGWHDCYAFDTARRTFPKALFNDIGYGAGAEANHVFINSVLGKYMDHCKGNRKQVGYSSTRDLKLQRTEPYWVDIATREAAKSDPPKS